MSESAREMLDNAESAMDAKHWIEANHWMVNFLCARLNKYYPIADLDPRYETLRNRLEAEMDMNVWLDAADEALRDKDHFAAEEALLTFAENSRGGGRVTPAMNRRYQNLTDRLNDAVVGDL